MTGRHIRRKVEKVPAGIVLIGASTGGPAAVRELLSELPEDFPSPIVVAQHLPDRFTGMLAAALRPACRVPVEEVVDGQGVRPGVVHVADGVEASFTAPFTLRVRPAPPGPAGNVDALFSSAALVHGPAVVAVVLTGMSDDGLTGAAKVRACGGTVLAQDAASSVVWGMPGSVVHAGLSSFVAAPAELGRQLLLLAR